jgi:hypothetical protein
MSDDDLFSWAIGPGARLTDPETSHLAADRSKALTAADRRMVLMVHANHPLGLTDFELADITGRQQTSVGKRRGELRDLGLIAETTERHPAPSGSPAIVWKITEAGQEFLKRNKDEST